jgi:glycosyltransferase involved in cell wall biosynthesis
MMLESSSMNAQIHILSFEGPDRYARAGGIASRVDGLTRALAQRGFPTHLWFVGSPDHPGDEELEPGLHVHRWCQWISRHHPGGVYDGEDGKERDYSASLPPALIDRYLRPQLERGGRAVILAEEWHTVHAVLHLDWLLRRAGLRSRVEIFWNANNLFGFDRIDWAALGRAARITTVSRYMRQRMWTLGCDPLVIPNGLGADAYAPVSRAHVRAFVRRAEARVVLAKVARWDPDKRWLQAVDIVADLRRRGQRPLLVARGGAEAHGAEIWARAAALGLRIGERAAPRPGASGLIEAISESEGLDVVLLRSHLDPGARQLLFRASDVVLANSAHEPFGLVGLEAMAAGGLACTGCTGEDYATPGANALVLQSEDPGEFARLFARLRRSPDGLTALRRAGRRTAREYAWSNVVERTLLPHFTALDGVSVDRLPALLLRVTPSDREPLLGGLSRAAMVAAPARGRAGRLCEDPTLPVVAV